MAAHGYPDAPEAGAVIDGIDAAEAIEGVQVFHAGTAIRDGVLVAAGGRVLNVTALDADLGRRPRTRVCSRRSDHGRGIPPSNAI